MTSKKWLKADAKTHMLKANGHTAEVIRDGSMWHVWINGENQKMGSTSVRWAKIRASMLLRALPEKRTPAESSSP